MRYNEPGQIDSTDPFRGIHNTLPPLPDPDVQLYVWVAGSIVAGIAFVVVVTRWWLRERTRAKQRAADPGLRIPKVIEVTDEILQTSAIHEAGHAVAGSRHGRPDIEWTITTMSLVKATGNGHTDYAYRADYLLQAHVAWISVVVSVAGRAAEDLFKAAHIPWGSNRDFQDARTTIGRLRHAHSHILSQGSPVDWALTDDQVLLVARAEAAAILATHTALVHTVAEALLAAPSGILTGPDLGLLINSVELYEPETGSLATATVSSS